MKSILISCTNSHWIHKHVVYKLMFILTDGRYKVNIIMPSHKPFVNNLHHIVNEFMDGPYDFWLEINSDNPPIKNPLDLVQLDRDIIGLPTPIWHYTSEKKGERPVYWNAYDYVKESGMYSEHKIKEGLQKVDAIGTGCLLISRRVFDHPEMRKAPFMRGWNEDGTVEKGNDIMFCERARANGFEIYCHYDYPCDHFSELSLSETTRAFRELYEETI